MKLKHDAFVTWGHESKSWLNEGVWNPFQEWLEKFHLNEQLQLMGTEACETT